jgi:hypothetical protein
MAEGEPLLPCDVQAPLLSLPKLLGTTLKTIPAPTIPYVFAEADRVGSGWLRDETAAGFCPWTQGYRVDKTPVARRF